MKSIYYRALALWAMFRESKWFPSRKWFAAAIANVLAAVLVAVGVDLGDFTEIVGDILGIDIPSSEAAIFIVANLLAFYITKDRGTTMYFSDDDIAEPTAEGLLEKFNAENNQSGKPPSAAAPDHRPAPKKPPKPTLRGVRAVVPDYGKMTVPELQDRARQKGIKGFSRMRKPQLVKALKKT